LDSGQGMRPLHPLTEQARPGRHSPPPRAPPLLLSRPQRPRRPARYARIMRPLRPLSAHARAPAITSPPPAGHPLPSVPCRRSPATQLLLSRPLRLMTVHLHNCRLRNASSSRSIAPRLHCSIAKRRKSNIVLEYSKKKC
jgi:hypothetical protein